MLERVFIVDESVSTRAFLYDLISQVGFGALTVPSGAEVLERLKNERPRLILIDDAPGEFSGFGLVKKIRDFDQDIYIVMMGQESASADKEILIKETGVTLYLKKDFNDPTTIKSILSLLKQEVKFKPDSDKNWGRVLVVDDELENRETVSSFLRRRGFEIDTAASGEECLERVKQNAYDLVLLDVTMTGMDGLLTLKLIKDINPAIKVVMVTGLQNKKIIDEAKAMGACDYLIKPFNFGTLESCLLSILLPGKIPPKKTG